MKARPDMSSWSLRAKAVLGAIVGVFGGRLVVVGLNRGGRCRRACMRSCRHRGAGDFGAAQIAHASGFGHSISPRHHHRQPDDRAHNSGEGLVVTFLDAVQLGWGGWTMPAPQAGLLVSPQR